VSCKHLAAAAAAAATWCSYASNCILITASICICLTSRAVTSADSSSKPVDAGLSPAAAAADAGKKPEVDGTTKTDSLADDVMLSKAVAQFYTGKQQVSGAAKVFTGYLTLFFTSEATDFLPTIQKLFLFLWADAQNADILLLLVLLFYFLTRGNPLVAQKLQRDVKSLAVDLTLAGHHR